MVVATVAGAGLPADRAVAADSKFTIAGGRSEFTHGDYVDLVGENLTPGQRLAVYYCADNTPVPERFSDPVPYGGATLTFGLANCSSNEAWAPENYLGTTALPSVDADGRTAARMWVSTSPQTLTQADAITGAAVTVTLSCGEDHPCRLVVMDTRTFGIEAVVPVRFAAPFTTSCGLPTAKTAFGAGPYSTTPQYRRWAVDSCATGGDPELLADFAETGETEALRQLQLGNNDFALSTVGFAPPGGTAVSGSRKVWFVPLSLQAAVLAFEGMEIGVPDPENDPEWTTFNRISELQATLPELATLYAPALPDPLVEGKLTALYARNPALQRMIDLIGGPEVLALFFRGGTLVVPDGATLAVTTAFAQRAGGAWSRGALHAFPDLGGANDLISNFSGVQRAVVGQPYNPAQIGLPRPTGVRLYITDSVTAARVGLTPTRLQNAGGTFMAPNAGSVAAGVAGMRKGADGTLFPDSSIPDANAYPLPLVTYAVVAQDLPAAHRQSLVDFLQYAVIGAQRPDALPPGAYPLTPRLKQEARTLLRQIGDAWQVRPSGSPATEAPASSDESGTPTPAGTPAAGSPPLPGASVRPARPADAVRAAGEARIPVFSRGPLSGPGGPALALLLVGTALAMVAYGGSGRPVPAPVGRAARRIARLARHPAPLAGALLRRTGLIRRTRDGSFTE